MAKITYLDIDLPLQGLYFAGLKQADRFYTSRVVHNPTIFSKKRIKGLTQRSLLPQIAALWQAFSPAEKESWENAGVQTNMKGYRLFVKDQVLRIKNGFEGVATPSLLHQSLVGNLHIESPGDELKIIQLHPRSYWISKPVRGKKGMRELVEITEDFALPLKISLNYKSNLTSTGVGSFAKYYARVWHSYQGVDIYTDLEIPLDFISDWKNAEATISSLLGYVVGYNLNIHLYRLQGDLFFDNIKAEHSGQNWVRDPYCNDIEQSFTRAFFQVPKHWVADIIPTGADFNSIYKDF